MPISAKYVHTNLIARDWRKLADFYVSVFGCEPVPPERDYSGADLERGTGVRGVFRASRRPHETRRPAV